jgi:O-antigen ligase
MKAGAITTTVAALIATFDLSFRAGSDPVLPVVLAGAFLLAVLLAGNRSWIVLLAPNRSWIVHAMLITVFTTTPPGIPFGIRVGGFYVFFYEFFAFGSLLYAIGLLRASPVATTRLQNSAGVRATVLFGIIVATGVIIGLLHGHSLKDIQIDVRGIADMMIVIFVVAVIFAVNDWRRYLKTIITILTFSLAIILYASVSGKSVGFRTEHSQLYDKTTSTAARFITQTTALALAVVLACVTLLVLGRVTAKHAAPMLIPSLAICFLSFSRNTILAIAGALAFALVFALIHGNLGRAGPRFAMMALVTGLAIFGLPVLGHAIGAGHWVDEQVGGYVDRVVAGFEDSNVKRDASAQGRLSEDTHLLKSGAEHPIFGAGFGFRYKPPEGGGIRDPGDFAGTTNGQLYAHNTYLWFYVKVGVVGAATFLMLIVVGVLPVLGRRRPSPVSVAAAGTLVGLGVALIFVPYPLDQANSAAVGLVIGASLEAGTLRAIRNPRLQHESQQPTVAIPSIAKRAQQLDSNFRAAAGRSGCRRQLEGFVLPERCAAERRPIPRLSHTTVSPEPTPVSSSGLGPGNGVVEDVATLLGRRIDAAV